MAEGMRGVLCSFADCLYFVKQGNRVFCKHPEVHTNPAATVCPFYRMDWQRKAALLAERFKKVK